MRLWKSGIITLVVVGLATGCDGGGNKGGEPGKGGPQAGGPPTAGAPVEDLGTLLATVNGTKVGSTAFEQAASRKMPESGDVLSLEEKKEVLDRLIDEELLYQEALRLGLDKDPKVKKVMVNTLLRQEVYGAIRNSDFTDEELQAYYEAHIDEFVVPEKVQIKRILIKAGEARSADEARAKAEEIRAQIAASPDKFKELAAEHSEDPYRRRGGDVGFVPKSGKPGFDQAIIDKAFEMNVDQISEVFETSEGFNIILIANKRERVERTYQQMKGSVLRKVKNEKLSEMYDQYTARLRGGAQLTVEEAALAAIEVASARKAGVGSLPGSLSPGGLDGEEGEEGVGEDGDLMGIGEDGEE